MKLQILNHNSGIVNDSDMINKIAFPLIGCGIDGLEWKKVREIIKDVFSGMNLDIIVCYLEKDKDKVINNE